MSQAHEDRYQAPELRAMHVEDEAGPDDALAEGDDGVIDDEPSDEAPVDVESGEAPSEDMTMVEDELIDQGEITAADQEFDP